MRRVYLVPNIITTFGLACGLFVIFKVDMVEAGTGTLQLLTVSSLLLLLAAFADLLDGMVARAFRAESEFGFMFDSLADAVSFGVAPSVLMLKGLFIRARNRALLFCRVRRHAFFDCRRSALGTIQREIERSQRGCSIASRSKKTFYRLANSCCCDGCRFCQFIFCYRIGSKLAA